MKLYHLSTDIFKTISTFEPVIPEYRLKGEDSTQPRICVATSIIDCMNGLCYENNLSNKLFHENNDCYELVGNNYRALKVYEFEYTGENILTPEDISHLVPDALSTKEHWVTESLQPCNSYIINIDDYETDFDSNMIISADYDILQNIDYLREAIIDLTHVEDKAEVIESLDNLLIEKNISESSITLTLGDFPINKEHLQYVINCYFSWVDGLKISYY